MSKKVKLRNFHQAKWDEPIIFEISTAGQRGILLPEIREDIKNKTGNIHDIMPKNLKRAKRPNLPELAQPQVLRHFLRLSQETLGQDITIDIGLGTCTMKYSPKIHEQFVSNHKFSELHPLQDNGTTQGILEIMYKMEEFLKVLSGMDAFTFQPRGGAQAVYSNANVLKAYFDDIGEGGQRNEIITTAFSHPVNAAAPHTRGYKVITLMPDKDIGYPSVEAVKAAVSEKTAGLFITNPEDTGIFNVKIKEITDIVHEAGGLCIADIADANGLFGITKAKEAGFDMCHYNLHKAFSSPHGSMGPGCGAQGVKDFLTPYLPVPSVKFDGKEYHLDYNSPKSVGKIGSFYGVAAAVLRAYSWIMSLGAAGLKEVSKLSILNNNYLMKRLLEEVKGISAPYSEGLPRMEQVRYSWEKLKEETGVGTDDVEKRIMDYGLQEYYLSHPPYLVKEPFTPEPNETFSKKEIDEYAEILKKVSQEAYDNPELVKTAPHNGPISLISQPVITKPENLIVTWRVYKKRSENSDEML